MILIFDKNIKLYIIRIKMEKILFTGVDINSKPLKPLGAQIYAQRRALKISSTALAQASGISRVTLYRIEQGAPSVAIGAYAQTLDSLGWALAMQPVNTLPVAQEASHIGWIPARIELARYPALAQLAWQINSSLMLKPLEAWNIYERNAKHFDTASLQAHELQLLQALQTAFGEGS